MPWSNTFSVAGLTAALGFAATAAGAALKEFTTMSGFQDDPSNTTTTAAPTTTPDGGGGGLSTTAEWAIIGSAIAAGIAAIIIIAKCCPNTRSSFLSKICCESSDDPKERKPLINRPGPAQAAMDSSSAKAQELADKYGAAIAALKK